DELVAGHEGLLAETLQSPPQERGAIVGRDQDGDTQHRQLRSMTDPCMSALRDVARVHRPARYPPNHATRMAPEVAAPGSALTVPVRAEAKSMATCLQR